MRVSRPPLARTLPGSPSCCRDCGKSQDRAAAARETEGTLPRPSYHSRFSKAGVKPRLPHCKDTRGWPVKPAYGQHTAHKLPSLTLWETLRIRQNGSFVFLRFLMGFPGGSGSNQPACYAGDPGSIRRSGRYPGEETATPCSLLA